ncbi:MAG TPA: HepT-like ribonuclease domain-containing protein [Phycisphaerae bacterium]|nr:HepT-like ribonuclease domain-containing protein [Phycisphaerae bacterium]
MDDRDRIRLQHMLDAAGEARCFAQDRTRDDLQADRQFAFALVRCIEIIGEAANNVSAEAKAEIHRVPWRAIVNMRHRLVHGYFDINLDIVWQTLTEDLPPLVATLEAALRGDEA